MTMAGQRATEASQCLSLESEDPVPELIISCQPIVEVGPELFKGTTLGLTCSQREGIAKISVLSTTCSTNVLVILSSAFDIDNCGSHD